MSLKSWETRTKPPSKLLIASANASMVSMSKWLVGSSKRSICGVCQASQANTTRHLCPSDNCLIGAVYKINIQYILIIGNLNFWRRLSNYLLLSSKSVTSNDFPHFISFFDFRKLFQHIIQRWHVHFQQLMQMLMVPAHFQVIVPSYHAFGWDQVSINQF